MRVGAIRLDRVRLGLMIALAAVLAAGGARAADSNDRFDNFRMRTGVPTELKHVAPDLYFLYDDLSSNSAFLVTDEIGRAHV